MYPQGNPDLTLYEFVALEGHATERICIKEIAQSYHGYRETSLQIQVLHTGKSHQQAKQKTVKSSKNKPVVCP
jgi:hypothetical protein